MNKAASMPATRFGGIFKLIALFSLQIGFIVVFHYLGSLENMTVNFTHFSDWLNSTPPEIALIASLRILALGFAYWLVITSFIYMAARAFNLRILIHALELTTIPGVRRVIDAGLAAAIIGGTVFGGAGAVFAKSSHQSQVHGVSASISQTVKEHRVLYNPEPAGNASVGGPIVSLTNDTQTSVPIGNVSGSPAQMQKSSNVKSVIDPTSDEGSIPSRDPSQKDEKGNYIPTPAGDAGLGITDTTYVSSKVDKSNSKSVIDPTPADSSLTTSTTAPKVTLPPTSPPVVSTEKAVTDSTIPTQVGGQQVQRPNDYVQEQAPSASSYTVVSGDNFWNIAKNHLRETTGAQPSDSDVAKYWVKLIDANRQNIRSGDPDLIFPGEVFTLPSI